jgi:hypothetical protein
MMSRTVGLFVAALSCLVLVACSGQTAQPPPATTDADSSATATASANAPITTGCYGVGQIPDLSGVPTAAFGAALDVQITDADYQVRIDPPEESQHPDLPKGSDEEILVLMITVTGTSGTLAHLDASAFQVFDTAGRFCIVPEDQVGYPLLAADSLTAGAQSVGSIGLQAMRNTRDFVVVHLVDGAPVAAWH